MPSLTQYNPFTHYVEIEQGEIVLTSRGGVPLVRYNTHDRGGLLSVEEVEARCRAHGYDLAGELAARGWPADALRPLPFLYTYGRADAAVVHGANVYAEHVREVLEQPALRAATTGQFQFGATTDPDGRATLRIEVELRAGLAPTEELRTLHESLVQRALLRLNSELRNAFEAFGERPLEVAATLRASPFDAFWSVAVPLARPGFITAAVLGFAHTVGEFGVVLMIGGNIPGETRVLSVAIYDLVETQRWREAHMLAGGLVVFSFAVIAIMMTLEKRMSRLRP